MQKEIANYFYYDVPCHGRLERVEYETTNVEGECVKKYGGYI